MTKPFEDALDLLDSHATGDEVEARNYRRQGNNDGAKLLEEEAKSYRAAIAFLEAGQKVHGKLCSDVLKQAEEIWGYSHPHVAELRALLATLPEEG